MTAKELLEEMLANLEGTDFDGEKYVKLDFFKEQAREWNDALMSTIEGSNKLYEENKELRVLLSKEFIKDLMK